MSSWLDKNRKKANMNGLLPNFEAMSHTGPLYAALIRTHSLRRSPQTHCGRSSKVQGRPERSSFTAKEGDIEGKMIQSQGGDAIVYSAKLWDHTAAILAIMREDNLDAEIAKRETELDAFGHVSRVVSQLTAGY